MPTYPGYKYVPDDLQAKINTFAGSRFALGIKRRFESEGEAVSFVEALGLEKNDGGAYVGMPAEDLGRWSRWNAVGREVVRRDLPKETKTVGGWETPNFGDPARGTHTHYTTREVWPRELKYGEQLQATVQLNFEASRWVAQCVVERVFDVNGSQTQDDYLYAASLSRHWFGSADVIAVDGENSPVFPTQLLEWEVLPPGTSDQVRASVAALVNPRTSRDAIESMVVRIQEIEKLAPEERLVGTSGLEHYLGFKFGDDFVVFENARYGNAIYIFHEDWDLLSRLSRTELLSAHKDKIERIVHTGPWESKLKQAVARYRAS